MTNREVIRKVTEGFSNGNTEQIIACVADDVRWVMPGGFDVTGKEAFAKEVDKGNFVGKANITCRTEIADGDYIAIEGDVQCLLKNGGMFNAAFFDLYRLEGGKVKEMRSYVVEMK